MKTDISRISCLGLLAIGLLVAVSLPAAALGDATATGIARFETDSNATCSRESDACLVAASVTGDARCEKATCAAISVFGDSESGCYSGCYKECGDDGWSWPNCSPQTTRCEGDLAFACANAAVSVFGDANAYTYCQWWLQSCAAVIVDKTGVHAATCYADPLGWSAVYCYFVWT